MNQLRNWGWTNLGLDDQQYLSIFALLSRFEEFETKAKHNHHNWELSFARIRRREKAYIPLIEDWLQTWEELGLIERSQPTRTRWPNGAPLAICLTHDVDQLQEYLWLERLRSLRYHGSASSRAKFITFFSFVKEAIRRCVTLLPRQTPPIEQWLELEDQYGFKSTFHFMADPKPLPEWEDAFYRFSDKINFEGRRSTIGELIHEVSQRGWDVGLHGSCQSHTRTEFLKAEKKALESVAGSAVTSTRQHHLMFDIRITPSAQSEAGLTCDSTLGSNINTEFRCGTSLPFFMYDLLKDQELPLMQVPLAIQDVALTSNMAGDEDLMFQRSVDMMDRVEECNGVLTLLWHNHYRADTSEFKCYKRVLSEAASRGAWGCSMKQLEQWCRLGNYDLPQMESGR